MPTKPFPEYKWQWATLTCTEGLDSPPVLLGVLRAMRKYEGRSASSAGFNTELKIVEEQTHSTVNLARTPDRNLLRNSGQYWKALDLIADDHGRIMLTPFGRQVADREITRTEFAMTVIKILQLPNLRIERNPDKWEAAGLVIKPLELIMQILSELEKTRKDQAYITPYELVKITIPLAGEKTQIKEHVDALLQHRAHLLDISSWPDCAPSSNDQRMAREFLLFLGNYGFCRVESGKTRMDEKYYLSALEPAETDKLLQIASETTSLRTVKGVRESSIPFIVERKKVMTEITARPQQQLFRKNVLIAYDSKCILTGEILEPVLEAAHIVPVEQKGKDLVENSFCFRVDVHALYDSGHLQIDPEGNVALSYFARHSKSYNDLPEKITIPHFVNKKNIEWRWLYY
jgi:hypothetical protein